MEPYVFAETVAYIHAHPALKKMLRFANKAIVIISITSYALLLLWSLWFSFTLGHFDALLLAIPIPAAGFVGLSLVRSKLNRPRPYQVYAFLPAIDKDTQGKSFPSRHVFSNFMIAMVFIAFAVRIPGFSFIPGILLFILGDLLGVIRMLTGIHFPKDVLVGAIVGIVLGVIMILLPATNILT